MPHLIFWQFCGTPCFWCNHYTGLFCIEISKHFFYNGQLDNALMDVKQIAKANMKNYLLDSLCSTQWGKNHPEVTSKSLAIWQLSVYCTKTSYSIYSYCATAWSQVDTDPSNRAFSAPHYHCSQLFLLLLNSSVQFNEKTEKYIWYLGSRTEQ